MSSSVTTAVSGGGVRIVLGTMELGRRKLIEDTPCHDILSACVSRGCCEWDTAFMYCGGKSEEIIGRFPNKTKVTIATKANPWSDQGLKYDRVMEQMRISLERLQMNSVDIFYLHAPDHNTSIEETLSACQALYEAGKFKELGLSNYASWEVAEIYYICKSKGWILPTVYQGMYNPITRMVEGELIPCLRKLGIRFYAYNPLAAGILTGKYQYSDIEDTEREGRFFGTNSWTPTYQKRFWRKTVFDGISNIRSVLNEVYGEDKVSITSATFRWMLHHSKMISNDAIIIGGSCMEHIISALDYCQEGPLDDRVVQAYEEAWQADKGSCALYYR